MKAVFLSCLACFLLGEASSQGVEAKLKTVEILGQACVDLQDWAETKQLSMAWNKKEEEVLLTNRWSPAVLQVNSPRGIEWDYRLAFIRDCGANNSLYVVRRSGHLAEPVLHLAKSKTRVRINTVALDAGHGGKDPGNQEGSRQEKHYTLLLAKKCRTGWAKPA